MKTTLRFRSMLLKAAVLGVLAAPAMIGPANAQSQSQSFQPVAPKQPEKTTGGKVVNESAKPMSGHADGEVLVGKLKGIVLVSSPKQVRHGGVTSPNTIEPGDVALARSPDFETAVQSYLGQPVTMKSLGDLTRSIVAFFREHDRPVVNVFVPEQSITSGFVQVVVVISRSRKSMPPALAGSPIKCCGPKCGCGPRSRSAAAR